MQVDAGDILEGRFRLERLAGTGGMGTVWRATDVHSGGLVALKLLRSTRALDADRFAREAAVLAKLGHPGIVGYVAHGTTGAQQRWIAMQWLEGESLADRLDRGPLGVDDTLVLARRLLDAIGYAHGQGVVHRDLKPSNVMLPDGDIARATLADFGVARLAGATDLLTRSNVSLGTIGYMAPEQIRAAREAGPAADCFALACVLYECLTGHAAFESSNPMGVLARILFEDPPGPRSLEPEVPEALDSLILAMLAKDPGDRPATTRDVLDGLERVTETPGARPARVRRARAESLTETEQRVVSVILAARPLEDTDSGRTLHDDDARVRLDAVRVAGQRWGARVEVLADGTVVCLLSGELPIEQAVRAARCALAIRRELPDAPVALATGRGIVAGAMPVGEAVDRAARLVAAGDAGAVVVEPSTAALLEGRFEIERVEDVHLLRQELVAADTERTMRGRAIPFVGRDREMAVIEGSLSACIEEPSAQAVLVLGAPGTGKSRVRREIEARVRSGRPDVALLRGRGDPWAASSPFATLASAIQPVAGIRDGEGPAQQREKLTRLVSRHVAPEDVELVVDFVAVLVGVPAEDESPRVAAARTDPRLMHDQIRKALLSWLRGACELAPVVLVIEDLHWADLASVGLIDAALEDLADRPFMVLALARPEANERFPNLWRAHRTTEVRLTGLPKRAAEKLVRDVLGDDLAPDVLARIITRADGNAFHLEELMRATLEGLGDTLPESVLGMLQARFDALDGDTRRMLRAASVFGERFWRGGVAALVGLDPGARALEDGLVELVARELVVSRGASTLDGEDELTFRHDLVRDAAYSTLTVDDRRLGHRLAGEWLENVGSRDAASLAEHFQRGGDAIRAVPWCRREAQDALDANDLQAALSWVDRGLTCGAHDEARGALLLVRGEALGWSLHLTEALAAAREGAPLVTEGTSLWYRGVWILGTMTSRLGLRAEALEWAERLREMRPREPDAVVTRLRALAWAITSIGTSTPRALADGLCEEARRDAGDSTDPSLVGPLAQVLGARARLELRLDEAVRELTRAIAAYDSIGDERGAAYALIVLGNAHAMAGRNEPALSELHRAIELSQRTGSRALVAHASFSVGSVHGRAGREDLARAALERALDDFEALGDPVFAGAACARLAERMAACGELPEARVFVERAVNAAGPLDAFAADALAVRSAIRLAVGEVGPALADAHEAVARRARCSEWAQNQLVGVARALAEAHLAAGDRSSARAVVAAERDRLLAIASRTEDPAWRESYLRGVPDNARIMRLAEELGA